MDSPLKFGHFDQTSFFTQISAFWSTWHFALKFQHFDQFQPYCTQTSNFLIDSPLFTHNTSFWTFWWLALKFQHFYWFSPLSSNFNILINSLFFNQIPIIWSISTFTIEYQHLIDPLFRSNFNILIDLTFGTQISTFWSISTLLHSNVNFLIDSPLFTQNTTFWTIWWLPLKFPHFDWFPTLSSNFNVLLIPPFHSNLTYWTIFPFHSNFSILMDLTFCTQIITF